MHSYRINHVPGFVASDKKIFSNIVERNLGYNQLEKFLKTTWENEDFYNKKLRKINVLDEIRLDFALVFH